MTLIDIPLDLKQFGANSADAEIINAAESCRTTARRLITEERYMDALERTVEALRSLRDFSDFENTEFRALLVALLFDLSEIHFALKDYKQSEKDLDMLFKVLDRLMHEDSDRFGPFHILAMELSTRTLRSRKKALDLLAKQQMHTGQLYEKVNSGVVAATEKLVESLRKLAQLLASSGEYRAAMKFYAEAIKYSKKRTGRVTRREIKMTIEMAEIMMRIRQMRPRAERLLNAILPHAVTLGTIELEEDILALIEIIDQDILAEPKWKAFLHRLSLSDKKGKAEMRAKKEKARLATAVAKEIVDDVVADHIEAEAAREVGEKAEKISKKAARKSRKKAEKEIVAEAEEKAEESEKTES